MDANNSFLARLNDFAYLDLTLTQWLGLAVLSILLWTVLRFVLRQAISNFKRMQTRRIVFGFGAVYNTPREKLLRIPDMVKKIIQNTRDTAFDRAHFVKFAESSLDFEVVYIMQTPDYNVYMDTQQHINLALFERFADEGIEFAFPSRTVIIQTTNPEPAGSAMRIPAATQLQPN
jgi:small-conductance mechanosensitive channel